MKFLRILAFSFVLALSPAFAFAAAPVADPGGPYQGSVGEPVFFDGTRSFDADDDFLEFFWEFGDGDFPFGSTPAHVYDAPGLYTVTLTVHDGEEDSAPAETTAAILPAPPEDAVSPEDGAETIEFSQGPVLVLEWEEAEGAEEYRYQLWKLGDIIPEPGQNELTAFGTQVSVPASELDPGAEHFWRVRTCANVDGIPRVECGNYSDPPWTFNNLLPPPEPLSPTGGGNGLPVRFAWEGVEGAESYLIRGETDLSSSWWREGFFDFVSNPLGWFLRLGFNFIVDRLGLSEEAIGCPALLWDENVLDEDEIPCVDVTVNRNEETGALATEHLDTACTFTKETRYRWHIATCLGPSAQFCGPFSDKESFNTNDVYNGVGGFKIPPPTLTAPSYDPGDPGEIPVVGFGDSLAWDTKGDGSNCAHFHRVVILPEVGGQIEALDMGTFQLEFSLEQWTDDDQDSPAEKVWRSLDAVYEWNAEPCLLKRDKLVCEELGFSETWWKFKTAGAAPLNLQSSVSGAVALSWDESDKAGSYRYQIAVGEDFSELSDESLVTETGTVLSYPVILPETTYWWRVATCADTEGVICGEWTEPAQFTTLPLAPPAAPENPQDGGQLFLPSSLSWQTSPGATYYQYQVQYISDVIGKNEAGEDIRESLGGCAEKVGAQLFQPFPITQNTSFFLNEKCEGEYRWAVRSCVENTCKETEVDEEGRPFGPPLASDWTSWTFTGTPLSPGERFGLVPCGRNSDNPATPYNEKEACQVKHLGFLLQNILDFVLWRLSLIALAAFAVFVAAFTYFSMGTPDTLARIRLVFRSFLIGFLLMILAWAIVNVVMAVLGFHIEFFGRWYELPF